MTKRSGGRKARIIERKAPLPNNEKPVLPGEIGGTYQPLKQSDMFAIHENILTILETIGFAQATPHCQETCVAAGAIMGTDGRLRMPRELVQSARCNSLNEI